MSYSEITEEIQHDEKKAFNKLISIAEDIKSSEAKIEALKVALNDEGIHCYGLQEKLSHVVQHMKFSYPIVIVANGNVYRILDNTTVQIFEANIIF